MTRKEYFKSWYEANKEKYLQKCREYARKRFEENPEFIRAQKREAMRRYRAAHPEYKYIPGKATKAKIRESQRLWRQKNAELVKQQRRDGMRRAYEVNPEKYRTRAKTWRDTNPKRAAEIQKKVRRKRLPLFRAYFQNRLDTDPNFKMAAILRNRLKNALKRGTKTGSAIDLLGCSIENFWTYLESKFETGMTRENHGSVWHVDHIMPCALFDLTKPEHQQRCFHFSNLQPLFAIDNLRKGAKHKEKVL
jgi:Prasinovirus endonuclease VII